MKRAIRLIVPAAGAGARMGISYPKTLFPIAGKPILGHILASVEGLVEEAVVVASPAGQAAIRTYLQSQKQVHARVAVQQAPVGMADAVGVGLRAFESRGAGDTLIIWGDQVTVRRETLQQIIVHHQATDSWLTFPTSRRPSPYIHIVRDALGKVIGVLEAREGDAMPPEGENDCGVFLAREEVLAQGLNALKARMWNPETRCFQRLDGRSSATGEFNFLPLIALWAQQGRRVEALAIAAPEETQGVNTREQAECVEQTIREI